MVPLEEIVSDTGHYGGNWFTFAEYMIYSDGWALRPTEAGRYEIFNISAPQQAMTGSLYTFLEHFLQGNVFDRGGLYPWQQELGIRDLRY